MKVRRVAVCAAAVGTVTAGGLTGLTPSVASATPGCSLSAPTPFLVGKYVDAKVVLHCSKPERRSVFAKVTLQESPIGGPCSGCPWLPLTGNARWAPDGLKKGPSAVVTPTLHYCDSRVDYRAKVRVKIGGKRPHG